MSEDDEPDRVDGADGAGERDTAVEPDAGDGPDAADQAGDSGEPDAPEALDAGDDSEPSGEPDVPSDSGTDDESAPADGSDAHDEGGDAAGVDPLDGLSDSVDDRDGDPFAGLREWDDAEPAVADETTDSADVAMPDEFEPVDTPEVAPFDVDQPPESDPFSEMLPEFAEFELGDSDEDDVWEALSAAQARGSVADIQDRTYAEVSKHSFCEQCEYFTGPPETRCTNEGTEILAFVDMETVRVVDCPVVAERRRLEEEH